MIKIIYINRSIKNGAYSFEGLFTTIKKNLKGCSYEDFYSKTKSNFLSDIFALNKKSTNIYHITGGLGYYSFFLPKNKTILTIHDTNHYEHDLTGIKKIIFGLLYFKLPASQVKYITVVSKHTKSRLVKLFKISESKIIVINNCYSNEFKKVEKREIHSPAKILHIGTKNNKNLIRLISALDQLDVKLTIIGKLNTLQKQHLKNSNIDYINKYNLTDKEIYQEYINTDILAFISLYEGFGLPIIEANAVGRAIITSNTSPMSDIAGDSACMVNPYDVKDIQNGIEKLISNQKFRLKIIDNGYINLKKFSPTETTSMYIKLYKKMSL